VRDELEEVLELCPTVAVGVVVVVTAGAAVVVTCGTVPPSPLYTI
jgi:hypothetical protein